MAVIFALFHDPLIRLFDDNEKVIEVASLYLMVVPISYGLWGVLMIASATFNSLGKPLVSTALSVIRMLVIYIPLAYLGQYLFGILGIFIAASFSNMLSGLLGYLWNRKRSCRAREERKYCQSWLDHQNPPVKGWAPYHPW